MFYHDLELQCLAWWPSKRRMDCLLLWSRGSLLPPGCLGRVPVVPSGPSSARPGEIANAGDEHDETIEGEGWRESWWIWVRNGAHHALHLRCSESACPLLELLAFDSFWVFGNDHRLGSMWMNSGNQMYMYINIIIYIMYVHTRTHIYIYIIIYELYV